MVDHITQADQVDRGESTRQSILAVIESYIATRGFSPTLRELCDWTGISSTQTMAHHLGVLKRRGEITSEPNKARTLRVVR